MSTPTEPAILTIGHSTQSIESFIAALRRYDVSAIADIRSEPYSRHNPAFNRDPLVDNLRDAGIAYVFLGRELGARPTDSSLYVDGRVQFARLATTSKFQSGIGRIQDGLRKYRIALMCAEADPLLCHRALLVSPKLAELGIYVSHILRDGRLETHDDAMTRLLKIHQLPATDVFGERTELVDVATSRQERKIAFRLDRRGFDR